MALNRTDNLRQQNAGKRTPGVIASLGLHFRRHVRRHDATDVATTAMSRRETRGCRSRVQTPADSVSRHSRLKPVTCVSWGESPGRQKMMMALVPVLAIVLLFLLKNPLTTSTAATTQVTPPARVAPVEILDVEIAWEIPPVYQPVGRDPMRLPIEPVATVEAPGTASTQPHMDLIVTGILYSEDQSAAIIDTFVVHEGERISGATVKKIEKDSVEFAMNGRTWKQAVEVDEKRQ